MEKDFRQNVLVSKKLKRTKIIITSLLSFIVVILSAILSALIAKPSISPQALSKYLNYYMQGDKYRSSLNYDDDHQNLLDPNTGQTIDGIGNYLEKFEQGDFEVDQVTTNGTLSNLGMIEGISFVNLRQEGWYNLISELHPVDIYGRYVPYTIDRSWTKTFWADDYLTIDDHGTKLDTKDMWEPKDPNKDEQETIDTGIYQITQLDIFERALQDMDYGFSISSDSALYQALAKDYGEEWVKRMTDNGSISDGDWSQMIGNSDDSKGKPKDDDFTYKTSFRIILEVPAVLDHIEISMPRYYDKEIKQAGDIGIEKLIVSDIKGNDFITTIENDDFYTKNPQTDHSDSVISVPFGQLEPGKETIDQNNFADVWWNKLLIGGIDLNIENQQDNPKYDQVWTLDKSTEPLNHLPAMSGSGTASSVQNSAIMDGYPERLLSLKIPRGYMPLYIRSDAPGGIFNTDKSKINLKNLPRVNIKDQDVSAFTNNIFSWGTLNALPGKTYYLFFVKVTFNFYEEFNYQNVEGASYVLTPSNHQINIPDTQNVYAKKFYLNYNDLASTEPILGIYPYFTFINWASFNLPKRFKDEEESEYVVNARYKIDYNPAWGNSYKSEEWTYVDLDSEQVSKLWLEPKSIVTIEFFAKKGYKVFEIGTENLVKFSHNYVVPDLGTKSESTSVPTMDFPPLLSSTFMTTQNVIETNRNLTDLGVIKDIELSIRLDHEWRGGNTEADWYDADAFITELSFLDAASRPINYYVTYYSSNESLIDGSQYTKEEYERIADVWNDGSKELDSLANANYKYPFSVDDSTDNEFGHYNNYRYHIDVKKDNVIKVKISFKVQSVISKIMMGAGAFWIEDVPFIENIKVTRSDNSVYSTSILRTGKRQQTWTNASGGITPDGNTNGRFIDSHLFPDEVYKYCLQYNKNYRTVTKTGLSSYYGITPLTWYQEGVVDEVTNGSLTGLGPIASGNIGFWASKNNLDNMNIAELHFYGLDGEEITYQVLKTYHLAGAVNDVAHPNILEESRWEIGKADAPNTPRDRNYGILMSAFMKYYYKFGNEINVDTNSAAYQEIIKETISYQDDYTAGFNWLNQALTRSWDEWTTQKPSDWDASEEGPLVSGDNYNWVKNNFNQVFKGRGTENLWAAMENWREKLMSASVGDHKKQVYLLHNPTIDFGDVQIDNFIVGFEEDNLTLREVIGDFYPGFQGIELSPWGANNLQEIWQDDDETTSLATADGWNETWEGFYEQLNRQIMGQVPFLQIDFVFPDGPQIISKIVIKYKGIDNLDKTENIEQGNSPSRISLRLRNEENIEYVTDYVKPTDQNGDPFTLEKEEGAAQKYHTGYFGIGEMKWAKTTSFAGDQIAFGQLAMDSWFSRKLFAQVYNDDIDKWESISVFKIKDDDLLKMRIGFWASDGVQGIFKNGKLWMEFNWKPPKMENKTIVWDEAEKPEIIFSGLNDYGTFDTTPFINSTHYDLEITVSSGLEQNTYYNSMPYVLKNHDHLTIKLVAKDGFNFVNKEGENLGKEITVYQDYEVNGLSTDQVYVDFDQKITLNVNGYNGSGRLEFNASSLPDNLTWRARVERNGKTISNLESREVFPNDLFVGDKVHLDIFGKNGYWINHQDKKSEQILDYATFEITENDLLEATKVPMLTEADLAKFNDVVFVSHPNQYGKYVIWQDPSILDIFTKWENENNVKIVYNIISKDGSFEPILANVESISDSRLIFTKNQTLEIVITPNGSDKIFYDPTHPETNPSLINQKFKKEILVEDHIEVKDTQYYPYSSQFLPPKLAYFGGNEEGYLNLGEDKDFDYRDLVGKFNITLEWFSNKEKQETINLTPNLIDEHLFKGLQNRDQIVITISLKEGDHWIEEEKGQKIPDDEVLTKTYVVTGLRKYASEEEPPRLNLNMQGYEGKVILGDPLYEVDSPSGPSNALITNFKAWISRNQDVFVGVYLLRGDDQDKDGTKELIMRDPQKLDWYNPITKEGNRLKPEDAEFDFQNGDEILYYVVPKNEEDLLYGGQHYYIFDYAINDLRVALPIPGLIDMTEQQFVDFAVRGKDGEGYIDVDSFRNGIVNDEHNDFTFTLKDDLGRVIATYDQVSELDTINNLANGMTIEIHIQPKGNYFWGTDLKGYLEKYETTKPYGYSVSFKLATIAKASEEIDFDPPRFELGKDIKFGGPDKAGYVESLNLDGLKEGVASYLKVTYQNGESVMFPTHDASGKNFVLKEEKYHILTNGDKVEIIFKPKSGYKFKGDEQQKSSGIIIVEGLLKNIFDHNVPNDIISRFEGSNNLGSIIWKNYNHDIIDVEIWIKKGGSGDYIKLDSLEDPRLSTLTNGDWLKVILKPREGYIVNYDNYIDETKDDFYIYEKVVSGLDLQISDQDIAEALKDLGIEVGQKGDLKDLLVNTFPEGFTRYEINEFLRTAFNKWFSFWIIIYRHEGSKEIEVARMSISDLIGNKGELVLRNGYTVKLFGHRKSGYLFDNNQEFKDLSDYVAPITYGENEDAGEILIPKALDYDNIKFEINKNIEIDNINFELSFGDDIVIDEMKNKDDLLKNFIFDFVVQHSNGENENISLENNYGPENATKSGLYIYDFETKGSSKNSFSFKVKNLLSTDRIHLELRLQKNMEKEYQWIEFIYYDTHDYVLQDFYASNSSSLDFAKTVVILNEISKLKFVDDNNVGGEAKLDLVKMLTNAGNPIFSKYFHYLITIIDGDGIKNEFKVSGMNEQEVQEAINKINPLNFGDYLKIEAKINAEYYQTHSFKTGTTTSVVKTLYQGNVDGELDEHIKVKNITLDELGLKGPSEYARITNLSALKVKNLKMTVFIKKYNQANWIEKDINDLPTNLANGDEIKIVVEPSIKGGQLVPDGDFEIKDPTKHTFDITVEKLDLPAFLPNIAKDLISFGVEDGKAKIHFDWNAILEGYDVQVQDHQITGDPNDIATLQNILLEVEMYSSTSPLASKEAVSTKMSLYDFIVSDPLNNLDSSKGPIFNFAKGKKLAFLFSIEDQPGAESHYQFIEDYGDGGKSFNRSIIIETIEKQKVNIDNYVPNNLSYEYHGNVSELAKLGDEWSDDLAILLGKLGDQGWMYPQKNQLKVTFGIDDNNDGVYDRVWENELPTNFKNGDEIDMVIEVIDKEHFVLEYLGNLYPDGIVKKTYFVEGLNTIVNVPEFPDGLKYQGFENSRLLFNDEFADASLDDKIARKYQLYRDGWTDPESDLKYNLKNGDQVRMVYQAKEGYVLSENGKILWDEAGSSTKTSNIYVIKGLKSKINVTLGEQAIFVSEGNDFIIPEYQDSNQFKTTYLYYDQKGTEFRSDFLPDPNKVDIDITRGVMVILESIDDDKFVFNIEYETEIKKHYQIPKSDVISLPADASLKWLVKNGFNENYTFETSIFPNGAYQYEVRDPYGQVISDYTNVPPGSKIYVTLKTLPGLAYFVAEAGFINFEIKVPEQDANITYINVDFFSDLTFEGQDGSGTITLTTEVGAIFVDERLKIIFKHTKNGDTKEQFSIPNDLSNGDKLNILIIPIDTSKVQILNQPSEGFDYQISGLISPKISDQKIIIDISLYTAFGFVISLVALAIFMSVRRIRGM